MSKLRSENVSVYPSVRRLDNELSAKLFSESAYSNIIKNLSPDGSGTFIIKCGVESSENIQMCLEGYYFELNLGKIMELYGNSVGSKVYVKINKETISNNYKFQLAEILGDNSTTGFFDGLEFLSEQASGSIFLGEIKQDEYSSKIVFSVNSLKLLQILRTSYVVHENNVGGQDWTPDNEYGQGVLWIDTTGGQEVLRYYNDQSGTWNKVGTVFK